MEETSGELPNFSVGIDFLGPDPTSSKSKAEKNLEAARFANLNQTIKIWRVFYQAMGTFVYSLRVMRILRSITIKKKEKKKLRADP